MIVGSNRPGSSSKRIADLLIPVYASYGETLKVLDLSELPQNMFLPTAYAEKPEELKRFTDSVLESKGLLVLTPEYNGSMSGVLKYFIDMLPFPESFEHRPVAFIGVAAGIWGGLRAVEHLQGVFGYRNAFIYPNRIFLARVFEHFKDMEKFQSGLEYQLIKDQARGFSAFCDAIVAMKHKLS
jgi:NAD(P)H-dependent FMN reductase